MKDKPIIVHCSNMKRLETNKSEEEKKTESLRSDVTPHTAFHLDANDELAMKHLQAYR